jgi:hypothetical protein
MSQELKVGARLKSAACTTEVVVVKAPTGAVDLRCGGVEMAGEAVASSEVLDAEHAEGTLLGKRYTDDDSGIELLAVKAGDGSLSIDGRPLTLKGVKPLPASD